MLGKGRALPRRFGRWQFHPRLRALLLPHRRQPSCLHESHDITSRVAVSMLLCQELLPPLASQPIGKIHDPDTFKIRLGIPRSGNQHPGISVAYLCERGYLPLKSLGRDDVVAHLDVCLFAAAHGDEVDFKVLYLSDIDIIPASAEFEVDNVLTCPPVVHVATPKNGISESKVAQVVILMSGVPRRFASLSRYFSLFISFMQAAFKTFHLSLF